MYIFNICFVFLILTIYGIDSVALKQKSSVETIIQIPQGKLEGIQEIARNVRPYAAFLGVPFGKAARFEEAKPADGWNGTRDATEFGESCLQPDMLIKSQVTGSEDCLFLNIYTANPNSKSNSKVLHPVMVFIHGGGFQFGSGSMYEGKYFLSEDVVLVFINYRLGPFGFLKTSAGSNLGMKDQVLALKWVQQNIEYFGGDPTSVTIFGESAGAGSVSLHLLSPLSKGLFHRAISQSGVANSPVSVSDPARELRKLGILMDCPVSNQDYLIQCLKKINGENLLEMIYRATEISKSTNKTKEFRPEDIPKFLLSVDFDSSGSVFLPDTPLNLMQKENISKVPWINGVNAVEALLFNRGKDLKDVSRKSWNSKDGVSLSFDDPDCKELATIREYYVGGENSNDSTEVSSNVTDLFSDRYFNHPAKVASILHAKYAPSYLYYFTLKGTFSFAFARNPSDENGLYRPTHADELQYQFKIGNFIPEIESDSEYYAFSEYFIKLWVSFAKDGTVAPEKLSSTASPWLPVSNTSSVYDDIEWYQLDNKSKMIKESQIFNSRINF